MPFDPSTVSGANREEAKRLERFDKLRAVVAGAALFAADPASAGAALAGMGGAGTGLRDASGELGDNPAASTAALDYDQGAVHLGASWARLAFAGYVYAPGVTTVAFFDDVTPTDFSVVTPRSGAGRLAFGVWRPAHRTLALKERAAVSPGGTWASVTTRIALEESEEALGAVWLGELAGGDVRLAAGGARVTGLARGRVEARGVQASDGAEGLLSTLASRRSLAGTGVIVGLLYRPVPEGSLGVRVAWTGPLAGDLMEQEAGGAVRRSAVERPARVRVGLGGAVEFGGGFRCGLDLEYYSESLASATLFAGTPAARFEREESDVAIETRGGAEFPLKLPRGTAPVRAGFFIRQDPLPSPMLPAAGGRGAPSFRQDVTGWTLGTGWSSGPLRADLAAAWLLVTTHVRQAGPLGSVTDVGDTRSGAGVTASVTLVFGR